MIAWVIAVLCGVVGVVVFLTGVVSGVNSAAPANAFRSGEAATVALDPADGAAVYIATARNVSYRCTIDGGGKQARLNRSNVSQTVTSAGTTWTHILDIGITEPGSYKIACTADQAGDVRFGVGRNLGSLAGSIGGAALVFVLVPAAGLLFAIIVTIVVLVRRKGARNRMATG
ncbi:hypothetical protein [Streptosporangium sp. KLBMP 9127]